MTAVMVPRSISHALAALETERTRLDDGIANLERAVRELTALERRLARERASVPRASRASRPSARHWSPAARRAAAERMRRLWAQRRKAKAGKVGKAAKAAGGARAAARRSKPGEAVPRRRKAGKATTGGGAGATVAKKPAES